jgi:hypothetical protein
MEVLFSYLFSTVEGERWPYSTSKC